MSDWPPGCVHDWRPGDKAWYVDPNYAPAGVRAVVTGYGPYPGIVRITLCTGLALARFHTLLERRFESPLHELVFHAVRS